MELIDIIPKNVIGQLGCPWSVRGEFLMYKHYENIPVAFIKDGIVYVFLENRIPKKIIKLIKWTMDIGVEFYLSAPEFSNPSGIDDYENTIIKHYLFSYIQPHFYGKFEKIGFDLIENMVSWTKMEGCYHLIKEIYDDIKKDINLKYYDFYTRKEIYDYTKEIREEFDYLYRHIQIYQILNKD